MFGGNISDVALVAIIILTSSECSCNCSADALLNMTLFRRRVLLKEIEFFTELGVEHVVKLMAGRIDEIARSVDLVAVLK